MPRKLCSVFGHCLSGLYIYFCQNVSKRKSKRVKMDFTNSKLFFVENWALHFMFLLHNVLRQTDFAKLKKCKKEKILMK